MFDSSEIKLSDAMETEQSAVTLPPPSPVSPLATANPKLSPQNIIRNRRQVSFRGMPGKKISGVCAPRVSLLALQDLPALRH